MNTANYQKLASHLKAGHIYRRGDLTQFSKAVDRDLKILLDKGLLEKLHSGLYYKPEKSRFGPLPPNDKELIKSFLKEKDFLLYSWNQYNSLGLGLTQLYNRYIVYNHKRHGLFKLGDKEFDFKHLSREFPKKLSAEFLLVDLLNNLSQLAEDSDLIKANIKKRYDYFNEKKVLKYAAEYGKVATKHFIEELYH